MIDVRKGVDAVDTELIALLATRFASMRAAARIKPERAMVRDEARKAAVIAAACKPARSHRLPGEAIASLWEALVEASISYEPEEWNRRHAPQ
ncbi:MAG: chorismate mutase [Novosphingobium sp.]|nr:chorismate mutase [Novosphingobium sp.]